MREKVLGLEVTDWIGLDTWPTVDGVYQMRVKPELAASPGGGEWFSRYEGEGRWYAGRPTPNGAATVSDRMSGLVASLEYRGVVCPRHLGGLVSLVSGPAATFEAPGAAAWWPAQEPIIRPNYTPYCSRCGLVMLVLAHTLDGNVTVQCRNSACAQFGRQFLLHVSPLRVSVGGVKG